MVSGVFVRLGTLARFALLAASVVFCALSPNLRAQSTDGPLKRVLILYSFDNEEGIYTGFDHVLRSQLRMRVAGRVELYTEYLDLVRFPSSAHARDMASLLKMKYAQQPPDLVVPVSYSALEFLLAEGKDLFPRTPRVTLFNARRLEDLKRRVNSRADEPAITGVASTDEPAWTLDLALRLQPDIQHVAVLVGSSTLEHYWLDQLKQDFSPYHNRVQIMYLTGQPMDALLKQIAELPPHSIVLSTFFFEDATGRHFLSEEVLDMIARAARAPIYGIYSSYIGHGVIGGRMTNPETLGKKVADLAVAVLNGEDPRRIPFVVDNSAQDTVDWRQVRRWGIDEARVPPSTMVLFREPSAWDRYRLQLISVISLVLLQALLIAALILSVRRRQLAERALLREKTLSDAVIESLPGFFSLQDQDGKHLRWNKNARVMARFGPDESAMLGNIAPHDRDAALRAWHEVFDRGSSHLEADLMLEGGIAAPFYFTGTRVELEGKPYLAAIAIDLTEKKKAEQALRHSEARLRSLVENAPYGIGTISVPQDRFLNANPALVKLLGYKSEAEVLGLMLSRDLSAHNETRGLQGQLTRADFFNAIEFTWKRKDGKPVNVRASGRRVPKTPDQDELIEVIAEDITARRQLEEQLLHAQKMEALGQLAGSVAHDFNNLLGVIIGYTELLSLDPNIAAAAGTNLETIKKAGERAASLTAQLLAFSRRQQLQPTVINLNSLVRETEKMLQRLMGEDVEQKLVLEPALWKTRVDPGQMLQVIMNLVINSRQAMAKGGVLTIETANVTFDDACTFQGVIVSAGNYVMLSVTDTGGGMTGETLTRVFEPFFTTKPDGKGTGLGLATVYGIVKQSEGYIFAESQLGIGSTFRVYLPQVQALPEAVAKPVTTEIPHGSETLLVVEDEPAFRNLLQDGLRSRGYRVLVAPNGVEALKTAQEHADSIRLLITDVIMPQMSGPELVRSLRKIRSNIRVLYISGYSDDKLGDLSSSDSLGLIQKPFYIDDLVRHVQRILGRGESRTA